MSKKGTFFIIPGFRQKPTGKSYSEIASFLRKEGFNPAVIEIPWSRQSITENVEYFLKQYKKSRVKNKYILGFSYGAMIAFIASSHVSPEGLVLCSLSPYFKNDLKHKRTVKNINEFAQVNSTTIARTTRAKKVLMLYGKNEAKDLIKRASETFSDIKLENKFLIPVENVQHELGNKEYLFSIHASARILL